MWSTGFLPLQLATMLPSPRWTSIPLERQPPKKFLFYMLPQSWYFITEIKKSLPQGGIHTCLWNFWLISDSFWEQNYLHTQGNSIQMGYFLKHVLCFLLFCFAFKYLHLKCHLPVRNLILMYNKRDFNDCLCSGYCRLFVSFKYFISIENPSPINTLYFYNC